MLSFVPHLRLQDNRNCQIEHPTITDSVLLQLSSCLQREVFLMTSGFSEGSPFGLASFQPSFCRIPCVLVNILSSENLVICHIPSAAWVEALLTPISHILCCQSHPRRPQLHGAQSQGLLRAKDGHPEDNWGQQGQGH